MDESGSSAAEYALMLTIVGTGIGAAAMALSAAIATSVQESATHMLSS